MSGKPSSTNTTAVEEIFPLNIRLHKEILDNLHELYKRKNHDYGDSFHLLYQEEGMAAVRIRLGDKLNRLKTLTKKDAVQMVEDESIYDTLMDIANYSVMALIELDRVKDKYKGEDR